MTQTGTQSSIFVAFSNFSIIGLKPKPPNYLSCKPPRSPIHYRLNSGMPTRSFAAAITLINAQNNALYTLTGVTISQGESRNQKTQKGWKFFEIYFHYYDIIIYINN
jgi:hypothetical protein